MIEEEVKLKSHKELDMTNWLYCIPSILLNVPISGKQMTLNNQNVTLSLVLLVLGPIHDAKCMLIMYAADFVECEKI